MRCTACVAGCVVLALMTAGQAAAAPYWVAWEGDDYPENEGWERVTGFSGGSQRSLADGVLTLDSQAGDGVFDFYEQSRQIDPAPGEEFVVQWRAQYEAVAPRTDPGITVFSDEARSVGFRFSDSQLLSVFEPQVAIAILPGVFHDFELRSHDMRQYELRIDGAFVLVGVFVDVSSRSELNWGDVIQGAQSVSQWDFVRFGVVPEVQTACVLVVLGAILNRRMRHFN